MKIKHNTIGDVFSVFRDMKSDGIVEDCAIGGAVAAMFYMEPVDTHDLDLFVIFPGSGLLVSLTPAYSWLRERGFEPDGEHIRIHGVPVQLLAAAPGLGEECIAAARTFTVDGVKVRVVSPEHLIALWLEGSAASSKRVARAAALLESGEVDRRTLRGILQRYKIPARGIL